LRKIKGKWEVFSGEGLSEWRGEGRTGYFSGRSRKIKESERSFQEKVLVKGRGENWIFSGGKMERGISSGRVKKIVFRHRDRAREGKRGRYF
jgi:hypothetical protein